MELLDSLLQYDPKKRTAAADAMVHRYFDEYGPLAASYPPTRSVMGLPGCNFIADTHLRPKKASAKGRRQSVAF